MKLIRITLIALLIATCLLWFVSFWSVRWGNALGTYSIDLDSGNYCLVHCIPTMRYDGFDGFHGPMGHLYPGFGFSAFSYQSKWWPLWRWDEDSQYITITGTFWLPFLLFACPVFFLERSRARFKRRIRKGLCLKCSYNLKGLINSTCPECGAESVPSSKQESTN